MTRTIVKRDGREVEFDRNKIVTAIQKAMMETEEGLDADLSARIAERIDKRFKSGTVEDVQNAIEIELMKSKRKDVAKAYTNYRYLHGLARDKYKELVDLILEKVMAADDKKQNANLDEKSFGGRMGESNDIIMKKLAMDYIMSPTARYNHENNIIYTHDLNSFLVGMHNCLSCPIDDLLANGFNLRQTDIRPPQSVSTAMQLLAVIFQVQSLQQFGGVSATHLDHSMVPYVKKSFLKHYILSYIKDSDEFDGMDFDAMSNEELDEWVSQHKKKFFEGTGLTETDVCMDNKDGLSRRHYRNAMFDTKRETYQAVEGMYHNLNSLQSRSGNQLPFSSINYGTCTSAEGRMVTRALLEASIAGIGALHRTSIFPCGIFQVMEGVNKRPKDPNYDLFRLALQSTAKRLYPNYANVDWSGNAGYDRNDPRTYFSTMGERNSAHVKPCEPLLSGCAA